MIFFIEDNNYGISVDGSFQTPGGNIAHNLAAFSNLRIFEGDGADPEEASDLIEAAVEHVRKRLSPVLLRLSVPRLCGHSGADNQSYKTAEQKADELSRDPLPRLKEYCRKKKILTLKQWEELEKNVEIKVREALERALQYGQPHQQDIMEHLFYNHKQIQTVGGAYAESYSFMNNDDEGPKGQRMNLIDAVRNTLESELAVNPRVLVFGEDVGMKGGVHGATVGLQKKFGNSRVFDTSLSEEGIIGRSVGMAYAGLIPVPEIQFRKYLDPAIEQFNDTGTIRWRTNNAFAAPYILRIPIGHSKRTGDPWHSVSGEAIFAHTLGWRIAIPSNVSDAVGLLRSAIRGNDPTVFLEHRNILDTSVSRGNYPGNNYIVEFGKASIIQAGTQATVITWGEMVHRVKEASQLLADISLEIIDLRTIAPWDKETVLMSIKKTGRCLIAHEDCITAGFGAEIAAYLAKEAFTYLDAPIDRVATPDIPIPYNLGLMDIVIPTTSILQERIKALVQF
jgi:2-oxoisovalerate dehydrogenase E1 component